MSISGLERIGVDFDRSLTETYLRELEAFYLGDGWYRDGNVPRVDHYIPFAMHFYGLIYAGLAQDDRAEAAVPGMGPPVRAEHPALVCGRWRDAGLRPQHDLPLCLRRLLGGPRLCR